MTEDEARAWVRDTFGVPRETDVAAFADLVIAENDRQNLISKASLGEMWTRHIVDSAQLLTALPPDTPPGLWVDIGTGAGFPGVIVALLSDRPVMLVEPRRRRAEFLEMAVATLGLASRVMVRACRVEQIEAQADIISARAVAPLPDLLTIAAPIASRRTVWMLPKGINAREEVEAARRTWHGKFHVEPSLTQSGSLIVIATDVARR
jgi:16S rRNA (guanine527-N7)-methyltransferase